MITRQDLEKKTLKELKAIALELKLDEPWKDKRSKTSWVEMILWNINRWEILFKQMLEKFPEKYVRSVCQICFEKRPLAAIVLKELLETCSGQYTELASLIGHEALNQGELMEAASGYEYIGSDDRGLPVAIQAEDEPTEIYAIANSTVENPKEQVILPPPEPDQLSAALPQVGLIPVFQEPNSDSDDEPPATNGLPAVPPSPSPSPLATEKASPKTSVSPDHPISFGKTLEPLLASFKSVTRRTWTNAYAQHFIKRYEQGLPVQTFDKDRRYGGQLIGTLQLTKRPYKELLSQMSQADLEAEGVDCSTVQEFCDDLRSAGGHRYFKGQDQKVWVIRFEFTPLETISCDTPLEIGSTVAHKFYPTEPLGKVYKFFNDHRVSVDEPNGRNSYLVKNLVAARSPPG